MNDADLTRQVAGEFIERWGASAVCHLRSHAEIAASIGDSLSEEAWLDIALAAESLLRRCA
jgi:hypothetical protein